MSFVPVVAALGYAVELAELVTEVVKIVERAQRDDREITQQEWDLLKARKAAAFDRLDRAIEEAERKWRGNQ
jgi:hypothetical protein